MHDILPLNGVTADPHAGARQVPMRQVPSGLTWRQESDCAVRVCHAEAGLPVRPLLIQDTHATGQAASERRTWQAMGC